MSLHEFASRLSFDAACYMAVGIGFVYKGAVATPRLCPSGRAGAAQLSTKVEWEKIPDRMKLSCDEVAKSWHGKGS